MRVGGGAGGACRPALESRPYWMPSRPGLAWQPSERRTGARSSCPTGSSRCKEGREEEGGHGRLKDARRQLGLLPLLAHAHAIVVVHR